MGIFTEKLNKDQIKIPRYTSCKPSHTLASNVLMQLEEYGPAAALCARYGAFDEAFDILGLLAQQRQLNADDFIEFIINPTIGTQVWDDLWLFISNNDKYSTLVNDFLAEIEKQGLINMMVNVERVLNMNERLVNGLILMINQCTSWEEERKIIDEIDSAADRAMKEGQISLENKKILVNIKNKCRSQNKIIDICSLKEITFLPNINILTNSKDAMSTAIMLMRLNDLEIVLDMVPDLASFFTFDDICRKLVSNLMKSGHESLVRFMKGIGKKQFSLEYELVISVLIGIVEEEIKIKNTEEQGRKMIIAFIKECIPSDIIKCKCYCQLNIVDEAFAIAKSLKNKELFSLVMTAAQQNNDKQIETKCSKFLK